MITEDYVSFETAKLLKEKGFDESTSMVYMSYGDLCKLKRYDSIRNSNYNDITKSYFEYTAPTLQMAMKWLREVYNLFISTSTWLRHKDGTVQYYYEIRNLNNKDFETIAGSTIAEFDSPEKTYEAAIMCCLKNLI